MKVSDFGYSRLNNELTEKNITHSSVGPIRWMSPEAITYQEYSTKTDVWSFGIFILILFFKGITVMELYSHQIPFPQKATLTVATEIAQGKLFPEEHLPSNIPP